MTSTAALRGEQGACPGEEPGWETGEGTHPPARLQLLGAWRLQARGCAADMPHGVQRLLAFIALQQPAPRPLVAGTLWPEVTEGQAQASLRSMLWRLHRRHPGVVREDNGVLELAHGVVLDVAQLITAARRVLHGDDVPGDTVPGDNGAGDATAALRRGLGAEGGAGPGGRHGWEEAQLRSVCLLPGWYDDWVVLERERLRQLQLHALDRLAAALLAAEEPGRALDAALVAVQADPLRESAHRIVVRIHLREGNALEALRAYERFAELLEQEVGVAPSTDMRRLVAPLLRAPGRPPHSRASAN